MIQHLAIVQNVSEKLQRAEEQRREEAPTAPGTCFASTEERRRIARELHDEAGQLMTSLLVGLRSVSDARRLKVAKSQAKELRKGIEGHRRSGASGEVRWSSLDELGPNALQRFTDEYASVHHIRVELSFGQTPFSRLDTPMQISLTASSQELCTMWRATLRRKSFR